MSAARRQLADRLHATGMREPDHEATLIVWGLLGGGAFTCSKQARRCRAVGGRGGGVARRVAAFLGPAGG